MARPQPIIIPGPTGMGGSSKKTTAPDLLGLIQGLSQLANLYQGTIGASKQKDTDALAVKNALRVAGISDSMEAPTPAGPAMDIPSGGVVNAPTPGGERLDLEAFSRSSMGPEIAQKAIMAKLGQMMTPMGTKEQTEKTFAPQVKTDWLPAENGKYQLMSIDEVNKTTNPVMRDGKEVFATHKQLMEGRGAKLESVTDPYASGFGRKLGQTDATQLGGFKEKADDAISSLEIIREAKGLLGSGIYAGSAANIKLGMDKWLQEAGVSVGGKTAANTEAYAGLMGRAVGKIIKQFGSGTGLSDADREYAEKIAAGKITLTEQSMTKLLEINERMARFEIKRYNKEVQRARGIKSSGDYLQPIEEPSLDNNPNGSDMDRFWK